MIALDDLVDVAADEEISRCMTLDKPNSFFLFAGAGSGKTRSLIRVLKDISERYGQQLRDRRRQVAVVTYTNAACDEIRSRLTFDPVFQVSTIHSFAWALIRSYQNDIKEFLRVRIAQDL